MTRDLWNELCSYKNLKLAFKKARKYKTIKNYVLEFEKDLKNNLLLLKTELLLHSYNPKPLVNFIIRDPKTRKISKSHFRDRIIHHALCNILEPIFEKAFIYDSFANRKGKGSLKALERFDSFKRKVSKNNTKICFVLKADVQKYFDNVDHQILLSTIKKKISDKRILWLIRKILKNSSCESKGMPLGNLTSQFFANVYLNELDQFVKHKLKVKSYIRYVDDFVIFHEDKTQLKYYKQEIDIFLKNQLRLNLHPEKSNILKLGNRITFLGFRVFYYHKLLKKSNMRNMRNKFGSMKQDYKKGKILYDDLYNFLEGWIAYCANANTFKLRKKIVSNFEKEFLKEISTKELNRIIKNTKN